MFSRRLLKSDAQFTHRSVPKVRAGTGTGTPVDVRQLRVSSSSTQLEKSARAREQPINNQVA